MLGAQRIGCTECQVGRVMGDWGARGEGCRGRSQRWAKGTLCARCMGHAGRWMHGTQMLVPHSSGCLATPEQHGRGRGLSSVLAAHGAGREG